MSMSMRIENHQPIALTPLIDLDFKDGEPVYLGVVFDKNITIGGALLRVEENIWAYKLDGRWFDLYSRDDINRAVCYKRSLGRLLQPGEKIVIEFTRQDPEKESKQ